MDEKCEANEEEEEEEEEEDDDVARNSASAASVEMRFVAPPTAAAIDNDSGEAEYADVIVGLVVARAVATLLT